MRIGNAYNPTQGGDCTGKSSRLTGLMEDWSGGLGISEENGILLGILPKNYNEPNYGECIKDTATDLPYYFEFGITLGDGIHFSKYGAVIDMTIKTFKTSQPILLSLSELPVAFLLSNIVPYAYYSIDGQQFLPLMVTNKNNKLSNDTRTWKTVENIELQGHSILLSDLEEAHINKDKGIGIALYSHKMTLLCASHRYTHHDLTLISTYGAKNTEAIIPPNTLYKVRTIMAVGSINKIINTIKEAENKIELWESLTR